MAHKYSFLPVAILISICCLLCLVLGQAVAQTTPTANLSPVQVAALSQTYQQRALWFRDMPQFNRDSTIFYYHKSAALLEASRPRPYRPLAVLYDHLSHYYYWNYDNEKARLAVGKARYCYAKVVGAGQPDQRLQYQILVNSAFASLDDQNPRRSLAFMLQALGLFSGDQRPNVQAMLLKDKGLFYSQYRNGLESKGSMSLPFLTQSRRLYESVVSGNNDQPLSEIYKQLAWHYNVKGQADSCDYYFDRLHALLPRLRNPVLSSWYYSLRGNTLSRRGQQGEARRLILHSVALMKTYRLTFSHIYSFSLNLLGVIAQKEGRYNEAITYFTASNELSAQNGFGQGTGNFWEHLTDLYEQKGDYKKALAYYKKLAEANLANTEARSLKNLRENELQLNILNQKKQLAEQQTERNSFIAAIIITALVTVLLGLVLFGLYRNYRLKQRANQQLETLNAELATKNTLLDKRNAENELLLKEIHHRVKNNLEVVSSLLALQSDKITDPNVQEAMRASQNRVQSMGIIHQKLYQSKQLAAIEMRDYFMNLSESILDSFDAASRIRVDCSMPELVLDIDTAISVGLITNELLTNSLKYAFVGKETGTVSISLTRPDSGSFLLQVADDGIGKILGVVAKGTGFGTQLVDLLARQLDGILTYENQNGTLVKLHFKQPVVA